MLEMQIYFKCYTQIIGFDNINYFLTKMRTKKQVILYFVTILYSVNNSVSK